VNEAFLRAAKERAAMAGDALGRGYRELSDRPRERRNAEAGGMGRSGSIRVAAPTFERAGEDGPEGGLRFAGCASATGQGYEMWDWLGPYTEYVDPGAFGKTLARADLDVPLVIEHVPGRRLARTTIAAGELGHLDLRETDAGLMCEADLDPADPDVAYIAAKMKSGLIDEMSFRFMITKGMWSPDWTEYHIQEVDIHRGDVAICAYGANPNTSAELRGEVVKVEFDIRGGDAALAEAIRKAVRVKGGDVQVALGNRRPLKVLDKHLD
jgi:HK97 family phage prohead protease